MKLKLILASACVLVSSVVSASPIVSFIIDGDTFSSPFSITNGSDAGELITRFQLDLTTTTNAICFDLATDDVCNTSVGVSLDSANGTGASTGFSGGTVTDAVGGVAANDFLDISFTDFNAGEVFSWDIDVDFFQAGPSVFGDDLAGATALIDFSDGQRLTGILSLVAGNFDASAFEVVSITDIPTSDVPEPGVFAIMILSLLAMRRLSKK